MRRSGIALASVVAALAAAGACARVDPVQPTAAPPLPADPDVELASMQDECDGLVGALGTYRACPNLDTDEALDVDAWIERANESFAAGKKANPEPNAQKAIAAACRKAADSVRAATERCAAGPRPKYTDYP